MHVRIVLSVNLVRALHLPWVDFGVPRPVPSFIGEEITVTSLFRALLFF